MRRLFPLLAGVLALETSLFAAVAPLLPHYSQEYDLSKAEAGILLAAYPAGTLLASLPSGWIVVRRGPKQMLLASLVLFAAASVSFAFAERSPVLDIARFLQGVAGAGLWAAGMAWLAAESPRDRLGEVIGAALGVGIVGILFGPAIGGVASAIGPQIVFTAIAVLAGALALGAVQLPAHASNAHLTMALLVAAIRTRTVLTGFWLFMLPAVFAGVIEVLEPLRLAGFGTSGPLIGAVFVIAALVEAVVSPAAGRLSDRRGRAVPLRAGLATAVVIALLLPLPRAALPAAACVVLAFAALGMCWAPAMAFLSDAADGANLPFAMTFSLANVAWATGHMLGAAGGAPLAGHFSDAVPYFLVAGLCLLTLLVPLRARPSFARRQRAREATH
ncbi:MAG: hypothetical protein QOD71_820 [Thermoleophilaceae bacterium]|nr:hypothetical protein [Thermoleophilaceae bacterium]